MLMRSTPLVALIWATASLAAPAVAEELPFADAAPVEVTAAPEAVAIEKAPEVAAAVEHLTVNVEGKPVSVRARDAGTGDITIDATPIFEALNSRYEVRESILGYWRFQDGAVIGLDFSDGKVRANGVVLGKLPDFPESETADTWLTPNAIAVLTGTQVAFDEAEGWTFELDERLKPKFDLDLWVNGAPVNTAIGLEPRTVGPVLLVPLEPVVEALGHSLTRDRAAGTVTITRVHDSAVLSLELATGLVTVNGTPSGVSPNMSYAEPEDLVLPFSAVETLTGSHIELAPGSERVDVTLDDRLSSLSLPGERVDDTAKDTPFTPEKLDFQLSDRGPVTLDFYSRARGYNTKTTYETVGGLDSANSLTPRWMAVDIQALSGWRGTVGDYNGSFREFTGTNTARIRGASVRRKHNEDTIMAIAAGVPLNGATPVGDGGSRPKFGGFAAGARFIKTDGLSEYGVAASLSESGETGRIVAGGRRDFDLVPEGDSGFEGAYVSGDVGIFRAGDGPKFDARGRAETRYRINKNTSVQGVATYDGAQFASAPLEDLPAFENPLQEPGARTSVSGAVDWHASKDWGVLHHVAGGVRTGVTHIGGDRSSTTVSTNASMSTRIGAAGPDIAVDTGISRFEGQGESSTSHSVAIRGFQSFDWGNVTGGYTRTTTDGATDERFVATTVLPTYRKDFGDGAGLSAGPTASYVWTKASSKGRLGASVTGDSGQKFGEKLNVRGQVAALTSVNPDAQAANMFANIQANYRITDNIQLTANYSDDFGGRRDVALALRGSVLFNEPRKHTRPKEGTGVLKGRVFFDRNRDGIRQEDEPGIPGIRVSVLNTRLALNVDRQGGYTIQNIKSGLYTLTIDRRSLPLGMLVAEGDDPRATIGDGRVTTLDIPVIASGQLRGAVFVDTNANGELDTGEQRLEGQWIKLLASDDSEPQSIQSAAFGQYGFENLAPISYTLRVNVNGTKVDVPVELTDDGLFSVTHIPVPEKAVIEEDAPQGMGLLGTP